MKKLLFILPLIFFYLSMASGLKISVHYCGSKIKDISYFDLKEKDGCCGNKMKNKGCCSDKTTFIKINDTHQSVLLLKAPYSTFKTTDQIALGLQFNFSTHWYEINTIPGLHKPPIINSSSSLYPSNRVLLI